jgi:NADH-quinone oxidoreductase subunit M
MMPELHVPWLEIAIGLPLVGAACVGLAPDSEGARRRAVWICIATLGCTLGEWVDFLSLRTFEAHDRGDVVSWVFGSEALVVDELSAPLLPLAALLFLVVVGSTLRTKVNRFPFAQTLVSEAILLALFSCRAPWGIVALLTLQMIPPFLELRKRGRSTRVFGVHMGLCVTLLVAGLALLQSSEPGGLRGLVAIGLLTAAVLIRSGCVPVHCWMTDLFEHATLGTALLFVTPMAGAYAAMRLVFPIAPEEALRTIALVSLVTAVYSAGMALVQREARRFFCYLFLSNASLVLVGVELATPIGLTGALCVWLSVVLSLAGAGLTLRAIESRAGRLSLAEYHGLYDAMPSLAVFFLLTSLASIGFPGTVGFVGAELLVEAAVGTYPVVGMLVVVAAALNGIAVLHAYFHLFTGASHPTAISLEARWPEWLAVAALSLLIIGGGLFPQFGVAHGYHAAVELIHRRSHAFEPRSSNPVQLPGAIPHDDE